MKKMKLGILISFSALTLLAAGCSTSKETLQAASDVKTVEATQVTREPIPYAIELSGTLQPVEETVVSFEVGGKIIELAKEQGQEVEAGEVLGRLEDTDYRLQAQRAAMAVEQAKATLEKVNNGAREQELLQAQLNKEKAQISFNKAQEDLKKMETLYESGAIPKDTWEQAVTRVQVAERDLKLAEAALSLVQEGARKEDKEQTGSIYDQQVILKQQADLALQKTRLTSPVAGTVLAKLASEGQLISPGTPVYRIGHVAELKVILPVPDRDISSWQPGSKVMLDLYGEQREGLIHLIHPAANMGTGTIGVEVKVDNQDRKWVVGQVVQAIHKVQDGEALLIPVEAAIRTGEGQPYVFLVKNNQAIKTEIEIGRLVGNKLEVTSGLRAGDIVVTRGADRLNDGDAIEIPAGGNGK